MQRYVKRLMKTSVFQKRLMFGRLSVVKQMEQMSLSFKGVFCSSVFISRSMLLIMQTTFCKGVSFDPLSVSSQFLTLG